MGSLSRPHKFALPLSTRSLAPRGNSICVRCGWLGKVCGNAKEEMCLRDFVRFLLFLRKRGERQGALGISKKVFQNFRRVRGDCDEFEFYGDSGCKSEVSNVLNFPPFLNFSEWGELLFYDNTRCFLNLYMCFFFILYTEKVFVSAPLQTLSRNERTHSITYDPVFPILKSTNTYTSQCTNREEKA